MLKEKIQMIKDHINNHRAIYITGSLCVITAGITYTVMRERHAGMQSVPDGHANVTMRSLNFLSGGNIVNVVEREGRGHPGYLVQCLESGEIFSTQGNAARVNNVSPSVLSSHLNGKFDNVNGLHFHRIDVAEKTRPLMRY